MKLDKEGLIANIRKWRQFNLARLGIELEKGNKLNRQSPREMLEKMASLDNSDLDTSGFDELEALRNFAKR